MATITHGQTINELKPGGSASLEKIDFGGALEVRKMPSEAVWFYWRFTEGGRTARMTIGPYDSSAPPKTLKPGPRGYSVAAAREAARVLAKANTETPGGLRAQRERDAAAEAAQRQERTIREKYTLEALCTAYCDHLEAQGKESHRDARNVLKNHLLDAFPAVASKPAREVEKLEIVTALRRLTDPPAKKKTTARKLRAYLRAAYAVALTADSDTETRETFLHFGITENPVVAIKAIKGGRDKNPLTLAELRKYWRALKAEPDVIGAALRLHVATGGQRAAQLARLTDKDIRSATLRLLDAKGRRDEPRPHLLPITDAIRAELDALPAKGFKLSTDGGKTAMHATSLSAWAAAVGERAGIEGFQLKRVRSGIETALAEAGIPLHLRGQLQSHGIAGVQAASYDAHDYLPEKRTALEALHNLLERREAKNVTPIKRKKA